LATAPDGACIIRSNCSPGALRDTARMVVEIAGQLELTGEGKPN
jgi:hypothetical protein